MQKFDYLRLILRRTIKKSTMLKKSPSKISLYIKNIKQIPKLKLKLLLIVLHTFLLIVYTISLQYTHLIRLDEMTFLKWSSIVKHNVLKLDNKPVKDSVIFIDVSKDIVLEHDSINGNIPAFADAQTVYTDRGKLAKLFSILRQHPNEYKYILCDIAFLDALPGDSILKKEIEKTPKLIAGSLFEDDQYKQPIFHIAHGCVNFYLLEENTFSKMQIYYNDSIKTLPTAMIEGEEPSNVFSKGKLFTYHNNKPAFNNIIPEFYYRNYDLVRSDTSAHPNLFYLSEINAVPDPLDYLKNKYIVIGNFGETDKHETYLGPMPGPLILFDTFLTLKNQTIVITISWVLFLFIFYFPISYFLIIYPKHKLNILHETIKTPVLKSLVGLYLSNLGILISIELISFIFFKKSISIFYIASYLTIIEFMVESIHKFKNINTKFLTSKK